MFYSEKLSKFKNINHCFFSRKGGHSKGIYEGLNCGLGSRDNKENVNKNLNLVAKKMSVLPENLILMNQTHSNRVFFLDKKDTKKIRVKSDSLITNIKNLAIGVLTADCIPIILYDEINEMVGCVHAGWKGSISGIIENTLDKFNEINLKNKITACVGPCIGEKSYEVGEDFRNEFLKESKTNDIFFMNGVNDKFYFNLRGYVCDKLKKRGIKNVDNINIDTFKDSDNFFSHRRSQKLGEKDYGRCIATISLKT